MWLLCACAQIKQRDLGFLPPGLVIQFGTGRWALKNLGFDAARVRWLFVCVRWRAWCVCVSATQIRGTSSDVQCTHNARVRPVSLARESNPGYAQLA